MSDVELVVKIDEKEFGIDIQDKFQDFFKRLKAEIKQHMISGTNLVCGAYELETIDMFLEAFKKSLILPKGHGRLIDSDALRESMMGACMGVMAGSDDYDIPLNTLENAPTIIEADRSEE